MNELKPCPYCGETPKRPRDFFGTDGENLWGVSCENVNCHVDIGVWHEDESEAIHMWNALPRPLRWTKEPPTEPGLYWYREDENSRGRIASVYNIGGQWDFDYLGDDYYYDFPTGGQWAGPLETPLDDKRSTE